MAPESRKASSERCDKIFRRAERSSIKPKLIVQKPTMANGVHFKVCLSGKHKRCKDPPRGCFEDGLPPAPNPMPPRTPKRGLGIDLWPPSICRYHLRSSDLTDRVAYVGPDVVPETRWSVKYLI
jgi:hypothetical protein